MALHSPPGFPAFLRSLPRPAQVPPQPGVHGPSHLGGYDPASFQLCFVEGHAGKGGWPLPIWAYFAHEEPSRVGGAGWSTCPFVNAAPPTFASIPGVKVAFDHDLFELPGNKLAKTPSVRKINDGHLPWLRSRRTASTGAPEARVPAGTTLAAFREIVKALGGSVYERREDMRP